MGSNTNTMFISDYKEVLDTYGLTYIASGFHYQVGELKRTQGWILHLSVIKIQIVELFQTIIPKLMHYEVPFKIIRNFHTAVNNLCGSLGYINLGKIITIYPESDKDANTIAMELIELTKSYRGPEIPTDRHLGSIVYTRYGSFKGIIKQSGKGESLSYYYAPSGDLILDDCPIPFNIPSNIPWPFENISVSTPRKKKLINNKYYPTACIKPDVKGQVMRGIYFKKWGNIRSCLIKQGRYCMFDDMQGRDIRDRLQWQYSLYHRLKSDIPMPEVFDYFSEGHDSYLVMSYIKGISMRDWLNQVYKGRSWFDLSTRSKLELMDKLYTIVEIIQKLHEKGYVHRDINSGNFIIDRHGKIWLIDMELAWSTEELFPHPAFRIGTTGYMSPEQHAELEPTFAQDIYAVGAMIQEFTTSLYPYLLDQSSTTTLSNAINFLTRNPEISRMATICQSLNPLDRPSIQSLRENIQSIRLEITNSLQRDEPFSCKPMPHDELQSLIQKGLLGLKEPNIYHPKSGWISIKRREEAHIGNMQLEAEVYEGWHTGIAGPLWLLGKAANAGIDIDACQGEYRNTLTYLINRITNRPHNVSPGLYVGTAGIALTLIEEIKIGLLDKQAETTNHLERCLKQHPANDLSLYTGWSGYCIALLNSKKHIAPSLFSENLEVATSKIIENQKSDGSWDLSGKKGGKGSIFTGLDNGIAGVLWGLLAILESHPSDKVSQSVEAGLEWLIKQRKKTGDWSTQASGKQVDIIGASNGTPGITLVLTKAFKYFKNPYYRELAESTLYSIPPRPVIMDFSLSNGLAGLGEVYLEAWHTFDNPAWLERADWITNLLNHTHRQFDTLGAFWISSATSTTTADLFAGNCGILHFLIRRSKKEDIGHPLALN